jgi:hypothetical protein
MKILFISPTHPRSHSQAPTDISLLASLSRSSLRSAAPSVDKLECLLICGLMLGGDSNPSCGILVSGQKHPQAESASLCCRSGEGGSPFEVERINPFEDGEGARGS